MATLALIGGLGARAEAAVTSATIVAHPTSPRLEVIADGADDSITLRLVTADSTRLEVLDGPLVVGTFTRADFTRISVDGGDGADVITIDEVNGIFTDTEATTLRGGTGNDVITGGSGGETLIGFDGDDVIYGGDGPDTIGDPLNPFGPPFDNGDDVILAGPGDDTLTWPNAGGNDVVDGEVGEDTVRITGQGVTFSVGDPTCTAACRDAFVIERDGLHVRVRRVNLVPFSVEMGTTEILEVHSLHGVDTISVGSGLAGLMQITLFGGFDFDFYETTASSIVTIVDGSDGIIGYPLDVNTLNFDAEGQPVAHSTGVISVGGVVRVTYSGIQQVNILNTSTQLPTIEIMSPTTNAFVESMSPVFALEGVATAGLGFRSITWVNAHGGSGFADGTTTWTADIPLGAGANLITVTVEDEMGNQKSDQIHVQVNKLSYHLAEGATGPFFDFDILVANPHAIAAPVEIAFLRDDASTVTHSFAVNAQSRLTIHVDDLAGLEATAASAVVTSTSGRPLVVERTMTWDSAGYGSHGGMALAEPRTRWLFAEGSHGFFDTYVLLANGNPVLPASATITFLTELAGPVTRQFTVAPNSRMTVFTGLIPELVNTSFSIVVDSDIPLAAERAMYFGTSRIWDGGHESGGAPVPSTRWFLAEGATGPFFDTFILVGNPTPVPANLTVTFLTVTGLTISKPFIVPGNSRLTINAEEQDPELANAAVSSTITSDQPVVVERAMYWTGSAATWFEAHNSFGATDTARKWGLAEGRVGLERDFETYILLANPSSSQPAEVRLTFLRTNGATVVKTYTVNPTTRFNVHVNSMVPELTHEEFGTLIEVVSGPGIVVERAMYSSALGETWAAGTNVLATRLP